MADTCSVDLRVYIQQPDTDKKGKVIGTKWVERQPGDRIKRDVPVKVTAESKCDAKMRISIADKGVVILNEGPPVPDENTCTRYQERVYYGKGFSAVDKNKHVVTFHVDADCSACDDCTGKATDDGKAHFD